MDEERFWQIIEQTGRDSSGDCERQQDLLVAMLKMHPPEQIIAFDAIFTEKFNRTYDHGIWAAAYVMKDGCGDDGFFYFREWLMGQGREVYYTAIDDPDALADLGRLQGNLECEGLGFCTFIAYKALTGEELPFDAELTREPAEPYGEDWEEEDLPALLPRLAALYEF